MQNLTSYKPTTLVIALCQLGNVSPRMFAALFRRFGSAEAILSASREELIELDGIDESIIDHIKSAAERIDDAKTFQEFLLEREIIILSIFDEKYPRILDELNDPPPLLFLKGQTPNPKKKTVALLGAEKATNQGMELVSKLAKKFSESDVQVISSHLGGIDAAVHLAVKASGGHSFAVLDRGFDLVLQSESITVAFDIKSTGGIISEYEPDKEPDNSTLKASNRLIAGLSQAVVVTEFYDYSERTLDLLDFCRDIGKLTFIVIDEELGALCDESALGRAISDGAILIEGSDKVEDIIKSLV